MVGRLHAPIRVGADVALTPTTQPARAPGFTTRDAMARVVLDDMYDDRDQALSQQWKNPPTGIGSHGFSGAALKAGGVDNGAPGMRRHNYYAAFVLDPDGNNIEAVFRG